jgi:hypothetical protein
VLQSHYDDRRVYAKWPVVSAPNRFFQWPPGAASASQFEPQEYLRTGTLSDMSYFCRVLDQVDRALPLAGLTFLVTWNVDFFDARFEGAVVLLIGDERYQTPSFIGSVRAVFKTGGTRPNPLQWTLKLPWSIAWRVILRDFRNRILTLRRGTLSFSRTVPFEIPLGTYHLVEVPFVPVEARPVDVFFAGTAPRLSRFNPRPSVAARLQLSEAIRVAEAALPNWRFEHTLTRTDRVVYGAPEYSSRTMNAKIVPCPRGNFDETFRLIEAAKSGCVIVTEPLPNRWYYRDAPVIQIRRWSELPGVLKALDSDKTRLRGLAAQTRLWWEHCVSEHATARYIVERLKSAVDRDMRVR